MALREELETSGNWLFRWRSYLPLVVIVLFLYAALAAEPGENAPMSMPVWELICFAVSLFGLGARMMTIGQVPKGTSGRNTSQQEADTLNTDGVYSVVRHPLYLGNFLMFTGVALMPHQFLLALVFVLVFWLYYERIMFAEEEYLRDKFGSRFLHWANHTPAFIPRPSLYRRADLTFCWKNILRREYNGLFALVLIMFAFHSAGEFKARGSFSLARGWSLWLGFHAVLWLTLRTLKRRTSILDTEGR